MSDHLIADVIETIVKAIPDRANPGRQKDAMRQRDKWLFENNLGTLPMTAEVRKVLEEAKP